jgi:integrase
MKGTVWQRCVRCSRKVNGADARKRHKATGCDGKDATWAFRVELGRAADGKRQQHLRGGFATEADAARALRELLHKVDGGDYVQSSEQTVAAFLQGEWLPAVRPKVAGGTYGKRRLHVATYTVPRIGSVPLQQVTAATLERLYGALLAEVSRGKGLAPSTVRDVHRTLHKAFGDAVRWGHLSRNPAAAAEAPALAKVSADARSAQHVWTADELGRFLAHVEPAKYGAVFYLAAMTGARRSELLGVRWSDVDLDAGRIRFGRTLVLDADGVYVLTDGTKTTASARTVALDPATVERLRRHRVQVLEDRMAAGGAWHDLDLVFHRGDGLPVSPPAVSQSFKRASKSAGLPRIRFHDLRHTHATLLLQSGEPVRTVSQRLGHASPTITMAIYSHVLPGDDEGAAARFAALLAL